MCVVCYFFYFFGETIGIVSCFEKFGDFTIQVYVGILVWPLFSWETHAPDNAYQTSALVRHFDDSMAKNELLLTFSTFWRRQQRTSNKILRCITLKTLILNRFFLRVLYAKPGYISIFIASIAFIMQRIKLESIKPPTNTFALYPNTTLSLSLSWRFWMCCWLNVRCYDFRSLLSVAHKSSIHSIFIPKMKLMLIVVLRDRL